MGELTIHHLARRLPYGLKCKVVDNHKETVATMNSVYSDGSATFFDLIESEQGFDEIKPYLRPLSHLTEDTEHRGDKFVPVEVLNGIMLSRKVDCQFWEEWFDLNLADDFEFIDTLITSIPMWAYAKLLEWHFVIDEPKGTYIEVTKENNPYK